MRRPFLILPLYPQWALPTLVPLLSTPETSYSYRPHAPYHSLLNSALHYSTPQHFKLILGHRYPFFCLFLLPAISGQVPEPFATPTQLPLSAF